MQNFNAINSTCSIQRERLIFFWKEDSCHLPEFLKALELSEIPCHVCKKA